MNDSADDGGDNNEDGGDNNEDWTVVTVILRWMIQLMMVVTIMKTELWRQ